MINLEAGFRNTFREEIKNFCNENNMEITYRSPIGTFDMYNISGEYTDIDKLNDYVDKLEDDRKSKSFFHRLFN